MNKTYFLILISLFSFCAADARANVAQARSPAPLFTLTDQNGQPMTTGDLKGKIWIVDFIFTRCGGACPVMTQRMIELAGKIPGKDVRFASISVDPEYDTPTVLKAYAARQGATDSRFVFLTGDANTIYDLAQKGFHVAAMPARDGNAIVHDEHLLLVDAGGNVREAYASKDSAAMARLVRDVAELGKPAPSPWLARFPSINASLNATSGILLCLAMMMIQGRRVRMHAALMIAAVVTSTLFLACYLTFHFLKWQSGSATTQFPQSALKPVYRTILISHSILAVVIVPMILVTLSRAARRRWDAHRRIARPTFWLWLYVSATGVVVYWMLYHLAPRMVGVA